MRYTVSFQHNSHRAEVMGAIISYLNSAGFKPIVLHGEKVWKKGSMFIGPQFIRINLDADRIFLEAWTKFELLPWIYFGEFPPAVVGSFPSMKLKNHVDMIEAIIGSCRAD